MSAKWGFPDDRVLPSTASSRQVGDLLRDDFTVNPVSNVTVVIPRCPLRNPRFERLCRGTFAGGRRHGGFVAVRHVRQGDRIGPPTAPTGLANGAAFLTVQSKAALFSDASSNQLRALHAVSGPAGQSVLFTGIAQNNVDSVASITARLPLVLGVIAVITVRRALSHHRKCRASAESADTERAFADSRRSVPSCGSFRTVTSAASAPRRPAR